MRLGLTLGCLLLVSIAAFGQVGNGTITGTVSDPAGAVVANAAVEAKNTDTGVVYPGSSTNTGNYTISNLPIGTYAVSVKVSGFKTYTHTNLAIAAQQQLREDVVLAVGNASDSVTVSAEGTLLSTETAEVTHNLTLVQLDQLPLLGIGTANSGSSGVRNPYNVMQTLPGMSNYTANNSMVLNGLGTAGNPTQTMRIEGQDMTNYLVRYAVQENQPSADAIQEVAIAVSNYSPEFGTAGAAVMSFTMKSGTNQYHGSGYDYFVNEDLNAGAPFSISTNPAGGKFRGRNRRNDFGGTMGGPIYVPKVYNGRNKSFFFWNYEEYVESQAYQFNDTVPTDDYRNGNFAKISPNGNCSLCSQYSIQTSALGIPTPQLDAKGRQLFANTIYDPNTRGVVAGSNLGFADPFPNNVIPSARFDPVTVKMEALIPNPNNLNSLSGNYAASIQGQRFSTIPSIKIDHNLDAKDKLSFYYSKTSTESQIASPNGNADGLPLEIGAYRGTFIYTAVYRLNYDRTLTPTMLLHLGAGWYHQNFGDAAPFLNFDPASVGLTGFVQRRQFPTVTGMQAAAGTTAFNYGGMQAIGTSGQIQTLNIQEKPTFNANLTWIHGSHSYKFGAEAYTQGFINTTYSGVTLTTSTAPTSQPFTNTNSLNGFGTGFGYASWLLGDYISTRQTAVTRPRNGNGQYALFVQDSWKATRKLTLDYGLRWDFATDQQEQYGRLGQFDISAPNANAGGHPGATRFASTCNCEFYQPSYKLAFGPRIGAAYQIDPKTVLRAGWGIVYQPVGTGGSGNAGGLVSTTATNAPVGINAFLNIETPGALLQPVWPVTDPNVFPALGTNTGAPTMPDKNQNRPTRLNQFSVGVQREFSRNLVVEASYVGNRVAWLGGGLGFLSQISAAQYAQYGLYPYPGTGPAGYNYVAPGINCQAGNDCDRALLGQAISSTAVVQKLAAVGIKSVLPYTGYPTSNSLASAIRPYPQFVGAAGALFGPAGSPTGSSKYDSLQVKVTKRLSHGLQLGGSYTWAKGFTENFAVGGRQDFFNPASSVNTLMPIPPQVLAINWIYTTPKFQIFDKMKIVNTIVRDWQLGGFMNYQSGPFLGVPASPTASFLSNDEIRVAGEPLYLKDVNDKHNINPATDVILNPKAWQLCPANANCGTNFTYTDFRGPRHPNESFNIGRNFRIKERMVFSFRGEFSNIFNRAYLPNPSTATPQNLPVLGNGARASSGFGTMSVFNNPGVSNAAYGGRTGTLVAKFSF